MYFLPGKGLPFKRRLILLDALKIALAAVVASLIARLLPFYFDIVLTGIWGRIANIAIALVVIGLFYIVMCFLLRVSELSLLREKLFSRFGGRKDT